MTSTVQLFTSLKADLRQDMNGKLICSRHLIVEHFLEGSIPLRLCYVDSKHRIIVFVILLIWVMNPCINGAIPLRNFSIKDLVKNDS